MKCSGKRMSEVIDNSFQRAEMYLEKAVKHDEKFDKAVKTWHKLLCIKRMYYPAENEGPVKKEFLKFDLKLSEKAIEAWSANEEQINNWDWGGAIEAIEEKGISDKVLEGSIYE